MKRKFAVMVVILLFAAASFGQAELEKYVEPYQATGAPIMITVTATDGKLAIEATGQGKAEIDLVLGEDFAVKGRVINTVSCVKLVPKIEGAYFVGLNNFLSKNSN